MDLVTIIIAILAFVIGLVILYYIGKHQAEYSASRIIR